MGFDNRTTRADMDDCFHLLSGDCSKAMSYGVLVRSLESSGSYTPETKKEVKVFIGSTDITMKLEGSNLLKNKLCGLCGDNNNNKLADVPSPRKCLLSTPELELASYRVSLPSNTCSPLPSHLKEQ